MSVSSDLYDVLEPLVPADSVFDTKAPDEHASDTAWIIYQLVSDVPQMPIYGDILGAEQRWQVSIFDNDLGRARGVAEAVKTALHGLSSTTIKRCDLEMTVELYDSDTVPPQYHIVLDFIIYT